MFIGKQANAITASLMAEFLVDSIHKEAKRYQRDFGGGDAQYRGFALGAAVRVRERARQLRLASEKTSEGTGMSLVLASVYQTESDANERFIAETMSVKRSNARHKPVDSMAFGEGQEYGETVSLNKQVT